MEEGRPQETSPLAFVEDGGGLETAGPQGGHHTLEQGPWLQVDEEVGGDEEDGDGGFVFHHGDLVEKGEEETHGHGISIGIATRSTLAVDARVLRGIEGRTTVHCCFWGVGGGGYGNFGKRTVKMSR